MIGWLIAGAIAAIGLIAFFALVDRLGYRDEMTRSRDLLQEEQEDRNIEQIVQASKPMQLEKERRRVRAGDIA